MYFSVVVPVFKTEKYLSQCIESVLGQSFSDYELILVDDGSPDQSGRICDEYQMQDSRITVIHKKNGGLSDARNAGIRAAAGIYLLFLDSDDFWKDEQFLEGLKRQIEIQKCDVLNYHYQFYYEEKEEYRAYFTKISEQKLSGMSAEQSFRYLVEENQFIASACNKVVLRELILQNNLFFRVGVTSEDIEWCATLASCSEKMGGCNLDAYCYRQREASITYSIKAENIDMLRENVKGCIKHGRMPGRSRKYKEAYFSYTAYQYGTLLFHINHLSGKERKRQMKLAEPYKYLLKYGKNKKISALRLLNRIIGFRGMNICLRIFICLSEAVNRKKGKKHG